MFSYQRDSSLINWLGSNNIFLVSLIKKRDASNYFKCVCDLAIILPKISLCLYNTSATQLDTMRRAFTLLLFHTLKFKDFILLSLFLTSHKNLESSWRGSIYFHISYHHLRYWKFKPRVIINLKSSLNSHWTMVFPLNKRI